jgi:hypothetical protein
LAEFAREHISDKNSQNLEEVSSADTLLESLILNRLNHEALSLLVLQRICRSHDYGLKRSSKSKPILVKELHRKPV